MEIEDLSTSAATIRPTRPPLVAKASDNACAETSHSVPGGGQRIYVKTYGCSHNVSDSEYMTGILSSYGYQLVTQPEGADLWLVNSCTVKDPSQAAFMHLVTQAKEMHKPVVLAGCVPQGDRTLTGLEHCSTIGVTQIDRIVEAVEQTLQGHTVKFLAKKALPSLDLPKIRKNPLVEIVPLSTGCLGSCTYCKTKHARGKLGSYTIDAIVERVRHVVYTERVSEVWLSSEDTGAYGRDIKTNIVQLLDQIVSVLPDGNVMLRLGMTNPPFILEHLSDIARILCHPSVYAFLHVPVQSGSNAVLDAMNREYTIEEFRHVVDFLQQRVPGLTIATDIICGFPTERDEDFEQTMQLIEHYQFPIVNISQFYPRPGTPAAKLKRLPTQLVKERSRRLTRLFESFDPYQHLVDTVQKVWFDIEVSEDTNGQTGGGLKTRKSVGHTKSYVKVLVPHDEQLPGCCCLVRISSARRFHIEGEIIEKLYEANYRSQNTSSNRRNEQQAKDVLTNHEFQQMPYAVAWQVDLQWVLPVIAVSSVILFSAIIYQRRR